MYEIGDVFIHRKTGRRVKIFEKKFTQEMNGIITRYRMSGDTLFLTEQQVQREYGAEVIEPQMQAHGS